MPKSRRSTGAKFESQERFTPRNEKEKRLIESFVKIKNKKIMAALLRDLLTIAEIEEFANRLEMAKLIADGHSYQEVAKKMNVSTTTVTRVAHWLYNGCGGYYSLFKK